MFHLMNNLVLIRRTMHKKVTKPKMGHPHKSNPRPSDPLNSFPRIIPPRLEDILDKSKSIRLLGGLGR
jgi:hypothetical protein